jgi:arginyl-tRNA synthetase
VCFVVIEFRQLWVVGFMVLAGCVSHQIFVPSLHRHLPSAHTRNRHARSARIIGLGAVKYADLSLNRESDYKFSYKKMLSLSGNTAPYMLYAYARIQSILRKAGAEALAEVEAGGEAGGMLKLGEPAELNLARALIKLTELLQRVEAELYPHVLCEYMYDLSQKFNQFYEACPVTTAPDPETRRSRLALSLLTARTLRLSLGLLGIRVLERM